jgi:phosphate transport system permease protein
MAANPSASDAALSHAPTHHLHRSHRNGRTALNTSLTVLAFAMSAFAMLPLFSVLYMLLARGGPLISIHLFTELTPGAGSVGGGIGNAILGTLVVVLVATILALPLGFLAAVYLAEYGGESKLAVTVRFAGKVLTGMPSILAGVFAYALVVVTLGHFSALAGGVATGILMVPVVMLTAEQALLMVPSKMKLAALGMGANRSQTVLQIVIPAAMPGILTGVMLALARAMGETAPLLFTALFSDYWFEGKLGEPIASLAVLIYNFSGSPFENQVNLAWAGSLVLVVSVLVVNIIAQLLTRRQEEH